MTKLNLLIFLFLLIYQAKAQKVYVTSNLEGKYIINTLIQHPDSILVDESFEITKDKLYAYVLLSDYINICRERSIKSTEYEIGKLGLKDNDTLNLIFYKFHSKDTTFYRSGCRDGTHKVSKDIIKEYNKKEREIGSLPDSIVIGTKFDNIVFYKKITNPVDISHGHGRRKGVPCGFSESTSYLQVEYTNIKRRK